MIRIVFSSKHPERGAALVRGTQIADNWVHAIMLGGAQIRSSCRLLGGGSGSRDCARLSRRLLVVHLKDLSPALFTQLPHAVHVLDPIDKIYRGWTVPTNAKLCGLITHSRAQARLYMSKGARRAWVVPDHGLPGCITSSLRAPALDATPRQIFARRTVVVLGGAPSSELRHALAAWARDENRRATALNNHVRVVYEKDLRAAVTFSQSAGWSGWLCALLRRNASLAVAWDQISGLPFQHECQKHMRLDKNDCFALKPAERFIVPLSAGVPTVGFRYPSFDEAAQQVGLQHGKEAADMLLADDTAMLIRRVHAYTSSYEMWTAARTLGERIGAAHSLAVVRSGYERIWTLARNGSCAMQHQQTAT